MRFNPIFPALWCAIFALTAFAPAQADACSCMPPSLANSFQDSDHVVRVRVQKKKTLNLALFSKTVYIARVVKSWKGCTQKKQLVRLATPSSSAACGVTLQVGGQYLVTGDSGGKKVINIHACGYNTPWKSLTAEDHAYLGSRMVCCDDECACGDGTQPVLCFVNPCEFAQCDDGECVPNYCGGCNAEFYDNEGYPVCGSCQGDNDCEENQTCDAGYCVDLPDNPCEDFIAPCDESKDCPDGKSCVFDGCFPSSCGCDPVTGDVICTADCAGGLCLDNPGDACEDFIAPCQDDKGCPGGMTCSFEGCNPSFCGCDPKTGLVNCTKDCAGGVCVNPLALCEEADVKDTEDGCNTCACINGDWVCTLKPCPEVCEPVACLLFCENGYKVNENGCDICECAEKDGGQCGAGDTKPAPDGCNTCVCINGNWACTLKLCVEECPPPADYDGFCIQVIAYAMTDSGQCCQYPNPCVVPPELDSVTMDECMDPGGGECTGPVCLMACEFGFKVDKDGCEICECNDPECPQILCINECEGGYLYDKEGCQTCECNEEGPGCPLVLCLDDCPNGYLYDQDGCQTCECKEGPGCPEILCINECKDGYLYGDDGCQTCECNEAINCPEILCINECKDGYLYGDDGCQTCECAGPGGGGECVEGDEKEADDGCNTCICSNGIWNCTKMWCPPCADFQPPCDQDKDCNEGQVCSFDGCNPSSCFCDGATGDIICTEDCGGGVCVDAPIGPSCGNNPGMVDACQQAGDQASCEDNGGSWGMFGLLPVFQCQCPTADADCPCKSNKDCAQWCLTGGQGGPPAGPGGAVDPGGAITGNCAPWAPYFGCFEMLPEENLPITICVD